MKIAKSKSKGLMMWKKKVKPERFNDVEVKRLNDTKLKDNVEK